MYHSAKEINCNNKKACFLVYQGKSVNSELSALDVSGPNHRFSECHGKSITLSDEQTSANRTKGFNNAVIFSADPIKSDELFEVRYHLLFIFIHLDRSQ